MTSNQQKTIDQDMRGFAYAISVNGIIRTCGSFPSPQYIEVADSSKLSWLIELANAYKADLYIGGYPALRSTVPTEQLIFGMTWENIQRRQHRLPETVAQTPLSEHMPCQAVLVHSAENPAVFEAFCQLQEETFFEKNPIAA